MNTTEKISSSWLRLRRQNRPVVTEKFEVEYEDESKLLALLDHSDNQNTGEKIKTICFLIERYCKFFMLWIDILMEETKSIDIASFEIWYRRKTIKILSVFGSGRTLNQNTGWLKFEPNPFP